MNIINNNHYRTFTASSEFFQGFKVDINITEIETLDDIVKIFVKELKKVLEMNNFEMLLDKFKYGNSWHIHTHTLEEILTSNRNDTLYICNHC